MGRKTRIMLKALAALLVLMIIVAGPIGFFWYEYFLPKSRLPAATREVSDFWATPDLDPAVASALKSALAASQEHVLAPSYSAAVGFDGKLRFAGTVGLSDVESQTAAQTTSRYRIGSTSKAMTGALFGRLIADRDIDPDQPVSSYVDGLPADYAALTTRQLASHTAGVRHYSRIPTWWPGNHPSLSSRHYETVSEGLSLFVEDPLEFEPGTAFGYSTYGYSLLAYAMEGAAGQDFDSLMQTRLFDPLEMTGTTFDLGGPTPQVVTFYISGKGKYSPAYPSGASYKLAGGGILSTASDVARFGLALLGNNYLDEGTRQLLFTPVTLPDGTVNPQNYGLGFRMHTSMRLLGEDRPTALIHHGGLQNGGSSFFMILPEHGISVAVLSNTGDRLVRGEVQDLAYEWVRVVIKSRD